MLVNYCILFMCVFMMIEEKMIHNGSKKFLDKV